MLKGKTQKNKLKKLIKKDLNQPSKLTNRDMISGLSDIKQKVKKITKHNSQLI
jgi:hypothetical protein